MGDRGNVKVVDGPRGPVYLYTHWCGTKLPEIVKAGLMRASDDGLSTPPHNNRWDDAPKLARCVFQAMIAGDEGATGYGIAAHIVDNEHLIIVLDSATQTVRTESVDWVSGSGWVSRGESAESWPMAEYVASDDPGKLIGFDDDATS